ncbi:polyphosphate kinase 1 [Solimonas sp. K1W22B-7]|uniref:polyphosphate kinase 1 n=1 Tax=Solimonas sp. K1W22B-7 TaxID=2303331 RepID=UPI000E32FDD3|nr:polyphosphate kinase 1 [Solimonas sp. K1W22B-7]AXQ27390.1 polyphosphate kinase 1 [Solimonas sp. K1W22B-7]
MKNPPTLELNPSELFLNRELSLLEFNRRVLAQALDETVPLLERLKFLCISSSNLDEFFEIRVAGLQQLAEINPNQRGADGQTPAESLVAIGTRAHALVQEQYRVFNEVLIPALEKEKIRFVRRSEWTPEQDAWLRNYFQNELAPVLSPIGLDPAHPFPRILNKSLNFIVSLSGKDAFGRNTAYAIVQAPRALPRLIQLPKGVEGSGPHDFVFLSSVIHAYIDELFPGMEASGCFQFRVTRNSDLALDEAEAEDLLEELEDILAQRQWGDTVRLEVAHNCPERMISYLAEEMQLQPVDIYSCHGPVNLMRLMQVPDLVDRPELKYPAFVARTPKAITGDLFAAIRSKDQLLHHPYESFTPVVEFLRQAARDPNVLAIKQTLYRTGPKSAIVEALIEAARNGKEVTAVVELRARFDEEANIDLAEQLQDVGAHVVYGVVGYKTHAKMCLIVRREEAGLKHYAHLGTGNYHPRTARMYTDYGLFTADKQICQDVHAVFLQLTSLGKVTKLHKLLQSPFTMAKGFHTRIEREIDNAGKGKPARVILKMNSLVEPEIIQALYRASQAGVQIDCIVRGMCSLRPGVKGLSDNITVRSIVGRFLEHHRVFSFLNDGAAEVWLSSADWMERNLFRRVEVAFPVEDKKIRARILEELSGYLADTAQSWILQPDGNYVRPEKIEGKAIQLKILEETP